ncbi:MAG: hypothetical protein WBI44_02545 [Syntrophaceticus sp.]
MSNTLEEMEVATISGEGLKKLQETEKAINSLKGGTQKDEIYLLALQKQGR